MSGRQLRNFGETPIALNRFDIAIEWLLVGLLLFMPLAMGARDALSEEIVIVISGAIVICFLLKRLFDQNQKMIWSWAYLPVGLFLLVAVIQLIPLPAGLISLISPNTVLDKESLLSGLPNYEQALKSMTLTFYANATRHDLRLILSVAGVFVVVLNVFRRTSQIKRLLMAITLIGGIVALIAVTQDVSGSGKIYWFFDNPHSKALSGPFINHNHFGQFMNLSIGAAIGWLCVKLHEDFRGRRIKPSIIVDYISSPSAKSLWLVIAIISLAAATVFASLTRGGMASMLIAAVLTTLFLCRQRSLQGRGWIMVVVTLAAFTCILAIGFDAVYDRFATLTNFEGYQFRWQTIKDLTAVFARFPLLGMGQGTHSVVYPMYQNINSTLLFTHAENEYAQIVEEAGLVGLSVLVVFAVVIFVNYIKSIRGRRLPICSAAYGLGFGLIAILIHSFSDYGQRIPANAFLSAIFCALLIGLARKGNSKTAAVTVIPSKTSFSLRVITLLAVLGIFGWIFVGANDGRVAQTSWKKVLDAEKGLVKQHWQGTKAEYADLISYASDATRSQPDNMHYSYCFNVYRWYSISKSQDLDDGDLVIPNDLMPMVHDIVDGFNQTCITCPTYGPAYSMAGQIEKFVLNQDGGAEKIRKGYRLAPNDPIACFAAGRLDVLEGKTESSIAKFEKAAQLDGRLFRDVVNMFVNYLSRPQSAISLAGDNVGRLNYIAYILDDMQYLDIAAQARQKAKEVLEEKCLQTNAKAWEFAALAGIYHRQQDDIEAIQYYRRALELDYSQVNWRLSLARSLTRAERIHEAMREAKICLRIRPQFKAAKKLAEDLSIHPKMFEYIK